MSAETATPEQEGQTSSPKGPPAWLGLAVGLAAAAAGAGVGVFVVAPKIHTPSVSLAAAAEPEEAAEGEAEGAGHGAASSGGRIFKLDNIIVNPAGSGGTRFLMVSVAMEVDVPGAENKLREQEARLRDAMIGVLESQTLEALTLPGARDELKRQLARVAAPLAGKDVRVKVYLPQFVIQ